MANQYMVLPSTNYKCIKLVTIPDDMEQHEAFRYVTGLVAAYQESDNHSYDGLEDMLEEKGFFCIDYVLGPELDCLEA